MRLNTLSWHSKKTPHLRLKTLPICNVRYNNMLYANQAKKKSTWVVQTLDYTA